MAATIALADFLEVEDIHFHFQAVSVGGAIPLLLRPALQRRLHNADVVEHIIDSAVSREEETSTLCGLLALPHTRYSGLSEFVLAMGINANGVVAGVAVPRVIIAFVSPEGKREQHLQMLATLARLGQNAAAVDRIAAATKPDDVIAALGL